MRKTFDRSRHTAEKYSNIREAPFSAALKKAYKIGINSEKEWLFCIDADVLLRPSAVENMMEIARAQSEKVFEIQSYIYDKFFGKIRVGGVHLYRTKYLVKAMNYLEQTAKTHRPEATTLNSWKQLVILI